MDIPDKLYKYRSLAPESNRLNTIGIFENNKLWYAKASSFNDPFDCNFDILSDRSNEEWEQVLQQGYESLPSGFRSKAEPPSQKSSGKLIIKVSRGGRRITLAEAFNPISAVSASKLKKGLDERVGVLSLTEVPDDILMWSHYTNGHDGICLEFDVGSCKGAFPHLGPVRYQDEYPEVTYRFSELLERFEPRKEADFNVMLEAALFLKDVTEGANVEVLQILDFVRHWFFTKSAHWSYEKEWRAIGRQPGLYAFPAAGLSGVVVGCVNTEANLALVRECVKRRRRKVKLYVAEKEPRAFRLRVREVE